MNKTKIKLELLAPARNLEIGKAAILAGADAVYIGGPSFGARAAAGNSWADIKSLVDFAHSYYAKVYLTLNTIFYNEETDSVKKAIWQAYDLGVDAIIIQDMGILEMDLPPIKIHASTQTNNCEIEHLKFLEKVGISRVVLARELSLSEITKIREQTKIELESFVHGALCVSYSGRCYFSQALSGRSANRGVCQQVCRLPFSLVDASGKEIIKDKYLLSTKDLNLVNQLPQLIEAGITSFKIEGRLKDQVYVTNVVAKYRQELDKIIDLSGGLYEKSSSGKTELKFIPDLSKTFNRGYTEYFLNGRREEIISPDNQKSLGKYVGKVKRVDHRYFVLDKQVKLKNGDGLCWLNPRGGLCGTNINLIDGEKIYPNKWIPLKPGTLVYCNQDQTFEKEVLGGASRFISTIIQVEENTKGIILKAMDEDNNSVEIIKEFEKNIARKEEQALSNWHGQLSKSGETIFKVEEVKLNWLKPLFTPISVLNDWRRDLLEALYLKRKDNYQRRELIFKKTNHKYPIANLDYNYNIANDLAISFYKRHGAVVIEQAFELQNGTQGKRLMTTKHCLLSYLSACILKDSSNKNFKMPLYLVYGGKKYLLKFDCQRCVMEIYHP